MMKGIIQLMSVIVFAGMLTILACKKETKDLGNNGTNNTSACNGKMMCFKLDGTLETFDSVVCKKIAANGTSPERYRIVWETNNIASYSNIEIDVYAMATGTYNVKSGPYVANDAAFQYYIQGGKKDIQGKSGTVTITTIDNTNKTISGTFTVKAEDNSTVHEITEGNFVNIPMQ